MDLQFTHEEEAFRAEVQTFLADKLSPALAHKVRSGHILSRQEHEGWHATLHERGWLANHWPREWGGTGWSTVEKYIFEYESALANAPRIVPLGINMLGPVLIQYGTQEQKQHWLPRILNGADWWAQGYSEPGAGSDLASIKTTAVREGEHYIVNGQKTWTSYAQYANMMFCLVRTDKDAKAQAGISFLLIDMNSPGVEVRPIVTLEGEREVNEVFLTDVKVPVSNLVGAENKGWTCAKYLLTYERTNVAGVGYSMAAMKKLQALANKVQRNGKPLAEDPLFAARMARVEIDLDNMKTTNLRVIAAVAGGGMPGAESSMLKIRGTEIRQEILSLTRRALGVHAVPFAPEALHGDCAKSPTGPEESSTAAAAYFNNRKLSIFGGSNEIQKNIISKTILGL